ncbi:MAG: CopD family protein [Anaerolineales bacterium]|nr:CopD family protein [Anaerolineales bacterium]
MTETPEIILLVSFWLHMLATVAWIGGLAAVVFFILPIAKRAQDADTYAQTLTAANQRLDVIGWLSLVVLVASGMFQMSANPNYEGFLAVTNAWARAILLKHIVFFAMIAVSAYLTWGITPGLKRVALKKARNLDAPEETKLLKRATVLIYLNLILGAVVLVFTALARIA